MQQILKLTSRFWPVNRFLVAAVALTAATWLAGDADFRAAPITGSMNLTAFPGKPQSWKVTGPTENAGFVDNAIELTWATPAETLVSRSLPIDPVATGREPLVRISGRIERLSGTPDEITTLWQARFLVIYRSGETILQYGAITGVNGQFQHQRFEYVVRPPAGSDSIELRWQLRGAAHWRLTGLAVSAVAINPRYWYVASGLVIGWLVYLACLSGVILRDASRPLMIGVLVSVCVIVAGTGMGQPMMTALMQPVVALIWSLFPEGHLPSVQSLLKIGHMVAFMLLTGLLARLRHALALSVAGVVSLCVTLAAASESLQRHRFNRSAALWDVLIDSLGIALAVSCFAAWRWWRARGERTSRSAPASDVSSRS